MPMSIIENLHFERGLDPVADAYAADPATDIVNLEAYKTVAWLIYEGVGTTGTATITVEACDDVDGTTTSAVAFKYRKNVTAGTEGALTDATSAGFTTTAGSSHIYIVEIDAEALLASGYGYARLQATEVADDPVLAGIVIILGEPRYKIEPKVGAIT